MAGRPAQPTIQDLGAALSYKVELEQKIVDTNIRILKLKDALKTSFPFVEMMVTQVCGNLKPNGKKGRSGNKKK